MNGKVAIVTGGGSGIGRATALELAQKGATVIVSDIDEYGADKTCGKILENEGEAMMMLCDVTDKDQVKALFDFTIEKMGRLDILINNAGIGGDLEFTDAYSDDTYDQVMDVNVKGVWYCLKEALTIMKKQNSGAIVNVSSVAGLGAAARMSAYAASKHAVIGLTKTVANEYGKYNIRANAVCPTVIDTPMGRSYMDQNEEVMRMIKSVIPMKRFGEAFEVAQTIAWLCGDESSYITGQALAVDGGMKA